MANRTPFSVSELLIRTPISVSDLPIRTPISISELPSVANLPVETQISVAEKLPIETPISMWALLLGLQSSSRAACRTPISVAGQPALLGLQSLGSQELPVGSISVFRAVSEATKVVLLTIPQC
ncbi:hypothetical protein AVEN_275642-1 [Araneus ventricosus]|uniref:Uncharacterized protein n=1 Tax=Araneus ventricosus TaxID=182803 RepID=A0A4Y2GM90_ARAVE|nr:hypothetical protein AVEN_275642-1 [Araneus ventricosus]